MTRLNIFPARVAIGSVQADGSVLMTPEFERALAALYLRVGGANSMSVNDLAALLAVGDEDAQVLALRTEITLLRALLEMTSPAVTLQRQVDQMRAELATIEDPAAQLRYIVTRYAPLLSPKFQGTPTAPTAPLDTDTTQLATCNFVLNQAGDTAPLMNGAIPAPGGSERYARADHVHPSDNSKQNAITRATVTGSRGGSAALASLLTALAGQGLITDSTTA